MQRHASMKYNRWFAHILIVILAVCCGALIFSGCAGGGTSGTGGVRMLGTLLVSDQGAPISPDEFTVVDLTTGEEAPVAADGNFEITVANDSVLSFQGQVDGNTVAESLALSEILPSNASAATIRLALSIDEDDSALAVTEVTVTETRPDGAEPTPAATAANTPTHAPGTTAQPSQTPTPSGTGPKKTATPTPQGQPTSGASPTPTLQPSATPTPQPTATPQPSYDKGDLNCDGDVNGDDVDPFLLALNNPSGYAAAFPNCDRDLADMNNDGAVNNFDLDLFLELLE